MSTPFLFRDFDRRSIVLPDRMADFTCVECGRPGYGPPNALVHPGQCREERTKRLAAKALLKRKGRKLAQRELTTC